MTDRTVGDLISACLAALGATRVIGEPLPGLGHLAVAEPDLADLLADADGRLNRVGVSLDAQAVLRVTSCPGAVTEPIDLTDPAAVPTELARFTGQEIPGAFSVRLDLDLEAPAPDGVEPLGLETTLERIRLSPGEYTLTLHSVEPVSVPISVGSQVRQSVTFDLEVNAGVPAGTLITNQARVLTADLPDVLTDGDGNPATGPEPSP
ncbi:MAG: hypothetical protein ACERLM_16400 [Acidimicrobiales bacterium]